MQDGGGTQVGPEAAFPGGAQTGRPGACHRAATTTARKADPVQVGPGPPTSPVHNCKFGFRQARLNTTLRSEYLSVDPYMRPYMSRLKPPVTMIGSSVAVVEQSTHPDFPTGTTVIIHAGWVTCFVF